MSFQVKEKTIQWNLESETRYGYREVTNGEKKYAVLLSPCKESEDILLDFTGMDVIVISPIISGKNVEIRCDRLINLSGIIAKRALKIVIGSCNVENIFNPVDNLLSYGRLSAMGFSQDKAKFFSAHFLFRYSARRKDHAVFKEAMARLTQKIVLNQGSEERL